MRALDITEEYYDPATRIEVLQTIKAQLLELLGRAETVEETLKVRESLDKLVP